MMQLAVFPNISKRRAGEIVDRIFNFYHNKDVRLVMPATEARHTSGKPVTTLITASASWTGWTSRAVYATASLSGQNSS